MPKNSWRKCMVITLHWLYFVLTLTESRFAFLCTRRIRISSRRFWCCHTIFQHSFDYTAEFPYVSTDSKSFTEESTVSFYSGKTLTLGSVAVCQLAIHLKVPMKWKIIAGYLKGRFPFWNIFFCSKDINVFVLWNLGKWWRNKLCN